MSAIRRQLLSALAATRPPRDLQAEARLAVAGQLPPDLEPVEPSRAAAVLLPIVDRPEGAGLLLTCRSDHLPDHPGQICFPGGGREPGDPDLAATALRETEEEVGIGPHQVRICGYLPAHLTITGFAVAPVVGLVSPYYRARPDAREVAEIFEMPLEHALDPGNHHRESRSFRGQQVRYWVIHWQDYRVWGATAAMIVSLAGMVASPNPADGTAGPGEGDGDKKVPE